MSNFILRIMGDKRSEEIEEVTSFVAADASGLFGLLAGHARMMTKLNVGLAKFRVSSGPWRYLALPGALLYFCANQLTLTTRHYLIGDDYALMSRSLETLVNEEREQLQATKDSLQQMEEEIFRRLWKNSRKKLG